MEEGQGQRQAAAAAGAPAAQGAVAKRPRDDEDGDDDEATSKPLPLQSQVVPRTRLVVATYGDEATMAGVGCFVPRGARGFELPARELLGSGGGRGDGVGIGISAAAGACAASIAARVVQQLHPESPSTAPPVAVFPAWHPARAIYGQGSSEQLVNMVVGAPYASLMACAEAGLGAGRALNGSVVSGRVVVAGDGGGGGGGAAGGSVGSGGATVRAVLRAAAVVGVRETLDQWVGAADLYPYFRVRLAEMQGEAEMVLAVASGRTGGTTTTAAGPPPPPPPTGAQA